MNFMSQDTWKFINTFAPWFSAIGTLSVVIVSLYLAGRDRNIRLKVSAGHRIIIGPGSAKPYPEYLCIYVVNHGHREAQITNIGWKVGIFKKQFAIQSTISDGMSSPLPIRLKDGEEAKYMIPLNEETNWLKSFSEKMLQPYPRLQVHFMKIQAFTSIGKTFESGVERNLKEKLVEANHE